MADADICYRPLTDIAADIKARRLSPVDLTKALLARIEALDPKLKSFTTVTPELALGQAHKAEAEIYAGKYRSPLHGVPIAVKDLCYTKGVATSAGMAIKRGFIPDYDATVVSRLAESGAVLLGKLHMTEGAGLEHHPDMPPPVNPWGAELWPGVSSSGSGVATAAGLCYGSLGSDTGGSVRFPSACNGLTGIKTTWGRVSRYGICDLAASFDTIGPMARSAADAAVMLTSIAGYDPNDPTSLSAPVPDYLGDLADLYGARGLRIGIDQTFNNEDADPEMVGMVEAAASTFAHLGSELHDIDVPDPRALYESAMGLITVELALAHQDTFPSQADRYGKWARESIESGLAAKPLDIGRGIIARDAFAAQLARVFGTVDAVLMPVFMKGTPSWAELRTLVDTDMYKILKFTLPINAARLPSVTFPIGFTTSGRPIGLQLVGPHCSEGRLLRAVHAYQQVTDWHLRRPGAN